MKRKKKEEKIRDISFEVSMSEDQSLWQISLNALDGYPLTPQDVLDATTELLFSVSSDEPASSENLDS